MKKDLITHFSFLAAFFVLITLIRRWFSLDFSPFWIGGVVGTLLPDLDHLVYVYFMKPHEATSQKVSSMISQMQYGKSWNLLNETRAERENLIFHTSYFQVIFLMFSFWAITSSGSLLGRGIVLAFMLHLLVDQLIDFLETKNLDIWFRKYLVIKEEENRRWYLIVNLVLLLVFGFFL